MKYCSACGSNVETFKTMRFDYKEPVEEECCLDCGMTVEKADYAELVSGTDLIEDLADYEAGTVLIAEDSPMMREMLKDIIVEENLAAEVVESNEGASLVRVFTERAIAGEATELMVLDVSMPVLNGINAAVAIRNIEKAFNIIPTPIMFFTAHKCDESFKKLLEYCKPALYLNKGASPSPDKLSGRISKVILELKNVKNKMYGEE